MASEPENTGGGRTPEATDDATNDNPFAAMSFEAEDDESKQTDAPDSQGEETNEEYALTFEPDSGLEPEEISIFTEAAKEYGLSKDVASQMFAKITKQVNDNNARVAKEEETKSLNDLRKRWGSRFEANAKQAGQFIAKVGKQAGWSKDFIETFKNPYHMSLFYDISQATGGRLSIGAVKAAPAQKKMTPQEIRAEQKTVTDKFWEARSQGRFSEAQELAEHHALLTEQLTGKRIKILRV